MNAHHIATRITIKAAALLRRRSADDHTDAPDAGHSEFDASGLDTQDKLRCEAGPTPLWSQLGHSAAHQITLRVVDRLADHAAAAVDRALTPRPTAADQARAMWRSSSQARVLLGAALEASGSPAAKGAARVIRVVSPLIDEMSGR